ncbi:Pentatricopeptide repeat-containing protein [Apostasia shenzhenica]|uniref:Pentatricopeptide repeat-containing protein n=1 Tax=Apostasia shenzhenica TaxID=1088818 RepID=A0A2I0AXY1_9ASPA|nr:Pentatricopeptide repeat-containing protein [Apostasia shenzhenica]
MPSPARSLPRSIAEVDSSDLSGLPTQGGRHAHHPMQRHAVHLHQLLHLHPFPSLFQTQLAHGQILKSGLAAEACTATKILSLYANHCRFPEATALLLSLPDQDSSSFSSLISSLSRSPFPSLVLSLLPRMLALSLHLDPLVLPSTLKVCASLGSESTGRKLHAIAITSDLAADTFIQSSLLHFYLKCKAKTDARKVFDRMPHPSVVAYSAILADTAARGDVCGTKNMLEQMQRSGIEPNTITWNGLIAGFSRSGHPHEAASMLQRMHLAGCVLDKIGVSSALPAVGDEEDARAGLQIHGYSIKCGFEEDECVSSALIDMYGKCRITEEMIKVFDEMRHRDIGTCNALVAGLARNGLVGEALMRFKRFQKESVELNVVSWTSIVACCAQNGRDMEALELFREMQEIGVRPNSVTIPCLLPACANIAALVQGKSAHGFTIRAGMSADVYVGSALIDMYGKCGKIKDARKMFDRMPSRNIVSWNAMLGGYAMHGRAKEAMEMFSMMEKRRQQPDSISFTCMLSCFSQAGLTDEGRRFFHKMKTEHGIAARMEHYACMVSLLSRAGKLDEAYQFVKGMPFDPDSCVWGALLSACRVHGNVKLGEIAAENLFQLEPLNAGNYVLLSNIYAAKGMWEGVDRVRKEMKRLGVRKNPGCSWIEIENKIHMLVAGDKSHAEMEKIVQRLEKIGVEMKRLGFLPSSWFALQDVEEQDKEQMLCGHSEKLAVGLGLISTRRGSPLRVTKNLRICGDCHAAMKFISRFEEREILVRDTNRFHLFRDGECSCGDFW